MPALKISLLTNMVAPYRVPFLIALANHNDVSRLRVLTCVQRETDREWTVNNDSSYELRTLGGVTINKKKRNGGLRIIHLRFGIVMELILNRPDRLIIGDASWTSFLAGMVCRNLRIPYFVWNEITTTSQISTGIVSRLRQRLYRGASGFVASCQMAKDYLIQSGVEESKIGIALNAVDNDYYLTQAEKTTPKRERIRKDLGIDVGAYCYIFVGQLIARKRILETIKLVRQTASHNNVHLIVAGSGPLENEAKSLAQDLNFDNISFVGYVTPDRLCELYAASDALLMISSDEPWGMVVSEAAIFGLKIIADPQVAAAVELARLDNKRVNFLEVTDSQDDILCVERLPRVTTELSSPTKMAEVIRHALG